METHSSILTWEIPWTEEPGELQFMESKKSQTQLSDCTHTHTHTPHRTTHKCSLQQWGALAYRISSQQCHHVAERSSDYVQGEVTASWKIRPPAPEKPH